MPDAGARTRRPRTRERASEASSDDERERAGAEEAADDSYGSPDPDWLRIDWRQHLRRVELPGCSVNYVEMGDGPPVVFVHGLSGCWQNWLENLPHFAERYRVIALDMPGFGMSPMPTWEISIPAYGRLLHDFCERLGISACAVVGNSMGGFIATEAAISAPGRFKHLALVSAAGITWATARKQPARMMGRLLMAAAPLAFRFRRVGLTRPRARRWGYGGIFHYPNRLCPQLLHEQVEPALQSPALATAMAALTGYDIRDRLEEIDVPTLVVWGQNDRIVPVAAAHHYHRRIPESELVIFERTGHLPQLERPARFNRLVDEFLER
jgi:pimeloyl-ACP methyl ester carboxylesterase